jgi:hypothetical protein
MDVLERQTGCSRHAPAESQPPRTCAVPEEVRLRPLCSCLPPRPLRGHAQKPLGGVGFPPSPRADAGVGRRGRDARACAEPSRAAWGRGAAGRGRAERGGAGA